MQHVLVTLPSCARPNISSAELRAILTGDVGNTANISSSDSASSLAATARCRLRVRMQRVPLLQQRVVHSDMASQWP